MNMVTLKEEFNNFIDAYKKANNILLPYQIKETGSEMAEALYDLFNVAQRCIKGDKIYLEITETGPCGNIRPSDFMKMFLSKHRYACEFLYKELKGSPYMITEQSETDDAKDEMLNEIYKRNTSGLITHRLIAVAILYSTARN